MRLINSSVEIIKQGDTLLDIYKHIEKAGRVSYKSEDRITEDSAEKFCQMLINRGHLCPLEQGTVYLTVDFTNAFTGDMHDMELKYSMNPYSRVVATGAGIYITTNMRVLIENNWLDDLKWLTEAKEAHEKRVTAKFICSRDISLELVRHRVFSYVQESSRYCNYIKSKFNSQITFIIPSDIELNVGEYRSSIHTWENINTRDTFSRDCNDPICMFLDGLQDSERNYFNLIQSGWRPEQARRVLVGDTKTEIMMTGFEDDFKHFFDLRCDSAAHPDMRKLAIELKEKFNEKYNF